MKLEECTNTYCVRVFLRQVDIASRCKKTYSLSTDARIACNKYLETIINTIMELEW